jgi:hypothetical protein
MKKIDNIAGIASVTLNPGYSNLLAYWNKKGDRPEPEAARRALMQLAGDYRMERVTVKPDVIDAMFRQVYSDETLAYSKHVIPGRIYATEYDLGSQGVAYSDTEFANTGKGKGWNIGFSMRNDGVDIQACTDKPSNGYEVFDIQDGEWLLFTTDIKLAGTYDMAIRYTSPERAGRLHLESNNKKISESMALPVTAKEAGYAEVVLRNVSLNTGKQKIKVVFDTGGFQMNYLEFRPASGN